MQFYTCCFIMYLNQVRIRVKQTYTMLHFVFSLQLHRPMSIDGVRNSTDDSEFARLGYHPYPSETTFTLVTHVKQSLDSYHDFDAYKLLLICYLSLFWLYHRVHISQSKSYIWAIYIAFIRHLFPCHILVDWSFIMKCDVYAWFIFVVVEVVYLSV